MTPLEVLQKAKAELETSWSHADAERAKAQTQVTRWTEEMAELTTEIDALQTTIDQLSQ